MAMGQVQQRRLDALLVFQPVAQQLDVEAAGIESRQPLEHGFRRARLLRRQETADSPRRSSGERDQPLGVALQIAKGDLRRLAALGREEGLARQLDQVAVAGLVLHQKHQHVRLGPLVVAGAALVPVVRTDPELAADDGLHPLAGAGLGELERPEQVAAIGDGHGRHGVAAAKCHQFGYVQRALGQRIGAVDPQVNEVGVRHPRS